VKRFIGFSIQSLNFKYDLFISYLFFDEKIEKKEDFLKRRSLKVEELKKKIKYYKKLFLQKLFERIYFFSRLFLFFHIIVLNFII